MCRGSGVKLKCKWATSSVQGLPTEHRHKREAESPNPIKKSQGEKHITSRTNAHKEQTELCLRMWNEAKLKQISAFINEKFKILDSDGETL